MLARISPYGIGGYHDNGLVRLGFEHSWPISSPVACQGSRNVSSGKSLRCDLNYKCVTGGLAVAQGVTCAASATLKVLAFLE